MMTDDDGSHVDEGMIHAWLDGELDEAQDARIRAHIGRCGACAAHRQLIPWPARWNQ